MSIKDRLKTAYENIALNGDTTWTDSTNTFQEANKKLYSKENELNNIRIVEERPRTVKDSIPTSKLATYADYEYNEARELCYTRCIQKTHIEFLSKREKKEISEEPWLLPDVDSLFMWFICCKNRTRNDCGFFESCNEHGVKQSNAVESEDISIVSPLLEASGFQEKKLRMSIISDKVKLIWNVEKDNLHQRCMAFARDIELTLNKLPSFQFFGSTHTHQSHEQFSDEVSETMPDFDHLKDLATSFKEQNAWITNCTTEMEEVLDPEPEEQFCPEIPKIEPVVCVSSKRLYSAVLQGLSATEATNKDETNVGQTPDTETTDLVHSILPSYATCCTTSISTVTVLNSKTREDIIDGGACINKLVVEQDVKIQKNTSIQTSVKLLPKTKPAEVTLAPKITNTNRDSSQNNDDSNLRSGSPVSYPLMGQQSMSYVNNYNYQMNASHYSNTFQSSCGCTNTFSHTSQVITNRNMQAYQRPNTFLPNQYQYAQPVLMLQQNRTSVYPISQPVQQPYYFQPLQHTRVMPRWIVPQNYSRPNLNQSNYPNTVQPHYVPQNPTLWMGSNQQQPLPSTSQYYSDNQNRNKPKPKKPTQPQISILKSKGRKALEDSSVSTDTTESDLMRRSSCANSASSGLEMATPKTTQAQQKKLLVPNQVKTKAKSDFEEVVSKTVNLVFEEETHVPVTSTLSEELEIQALEQYCKSTDDVYQELERQAAEQYDELSENWRGPPTRDVYIGGLSCFFACPINVNV